MYSKLSRVMSKWNINVSNVNVSLKHYRFKRYCVIDALKVQTLLCQFKHFCCNLVLGLGMRLGLMLLVFILPSFNFVYCQNTLKNGIYKEYYASGALRSEENYKNGKKDGLCREYYDKVHGSGLKWERNYKNGKLNGEVKKYYPTGELNTLLYFSNGEPVGIGHEYFQENGAVLRDWDYRNYKTKGIVVIREYRRDGSPVMVSTYKNNVLIHSKQYDESGKLILEQDYGK